MNKIIVKKVKNPPPIERKIKDMKIFETAYVPPWAYRDGYLNGDFTLNKRGGTCTLKVHKNVYGEYEIEYT